MEQSLTLRDGRVAILRTARPDDAQEFLRHRRLTCGETDYLAAYPDEVKYTEDEEREILAAIAQDPRSTIIVCELTGHIVGFIGISRVSSFEKSSHRASCVLSVERNLWGAGIGSALIDSGIAFARDRGFESLELSCYAENTRALTLYARKGFVAWGTHPRTQRHRDGTYHDEVCMTLDLTEYES